jgi:cell shape-determining protein MreD
MIWIGFILSSFMAVIQSALFPSVLILAYSPFIAIVCMNTTLIRSLWLAAFPGLCSDILSSDPMGTHTITSLLVAAILRNFRLSFFIEEPLQLCFYSALISLMAIPIQLALLFLFDQHTLVAPKSFLFDMIKLPLVNAVYAFIWFVGPLLIWEWGLMRYKQWRALKNG